MDPVLGPITSCGALLNVGLDSQLSVGLDVQAFCPFLAFQKKKKRPFSALLALIRANYKSRMNNSVVLHQVQGFLH